MKKKTKEAITMLFVTWVIALLLLIPYLGITGFLGIFFNVNFAFSFPVFFGIGILFTIAATVSSWAIKKIGD